jgi:hypothetical protein
MIDEPMHVRVCCCVRVVTRFSILHLHVLIVPEHAHYARVRATHDTLRQCAREVVDIARVRVLDSNARASGDWPREGSATRCDARDRAGKCGATCEDALGERRSGANAAGARLVRAGLLQVQPRADSNCRYRLERAAS